jgi:hypothetical protein
MKCERCPAVSVAYQLFDYCAECAKNLCSGCMAAGCCGHAPAVSGMAIDYGRKPQDPASSAGPAPDDTLG